MGASANVFAFSAAVDALGFAFSASMDEGVFTLRSFERLKSLLTLISLFGVKIGTDDYLSSVPWTVYLLQIQRNQ
jgi:hypothetical protein